MRYPQLALLLFLLPPALATPFWRPSYDAAVDCLRPADLRTNAGRLRCGMTPLPPTKRWGHSRAQTAFNPRVSPLYCPSVAGKSGHIQLLGTSVEGTIYLSSSLSGLRPGYGLTSPGDTSGALQVKFPAKMGVGNEAFELRIHNAADDFGVLGAAAYSAQVGEGDGSFALMTGVSPVPYITSPGKTATNSWHVPYHESQIWDYNCASGELTTAYVNVPQKVNGTVYPMVMASVEDGNVVLTRDPDGFGESNPGYESVQLFFVPA